MPSAVPKRLLCARCLRPQAACICRWITATRNQVDVLILQHPLEVHHAKGSARLLHLSLQRSRLHTGEAFAAEELRAMLQQPLPAGEPAAVLLYPDSPGMPSPPPLDPAALRTPGHVRLVVLDGTWRKSRKMLYRNPLLQQLPRLPLHDAPASRYRIRQAHQAGQLSTLEAVCQALMHLEQAEEKYLPLLRAFDGFVAQQLGYRDWTPPPGRESGGE